MNSIAVQSGMPGVQLWEFDATLLDGNVLSGYGTRSVQRRGAAVTASYFDNSAMAIVI
jgi:hypothetical protein